jgi:hypothetical protein
VGRIGAISDHEEGRKNRRGRGHFRVKKSPWTRAFSRQKIAVDAGIFASKNRRGRGHFRVKKSPWTYRVGREKLMLGEAMYP